MILVDSSVWIDHLRSRDAALAELLLRGQVLAHPFVIGELALGSLRQREEIIGALLDLPKAIVAEDAEVLALIARETLYGRGIGYIDAHLLASVRLTPDALLWSRDRRLHDAAGRLGIALSSGSGRSPS
ncbi:type II toxin-antitoxin system VapC family toxin [Sphingomonas pokkalii]|uniref:Ribonuclease VapC n=1 Tax=Sphingomonas pokkalii TaxID=2175090 RepID=A0A2U0SEE5_9SPHN|nr:type II toxin-antitoxin system VapC family toxin [Sphingomonas pokkalii]PVX29729.1 VapC toxin family PIN domain ribonuclease [Sphingomonas pokkalii]